MSLNGNLLSQLKRKLEERDETGEYVVSCQPLIAFYKAAAVHFEPSIELARIVFSGSMRDDAYVSNHLCVFDFIYSSIWSVLTSQTVTLKSSVAARSLPSGDHATVGSRANRGGRACPLIRGLRAAHRCDRDHNDG